jgi:hypothetical protein
MLHLTDLSVFYTLHFSKINTEKTGLDAAEGSAVLPHPFIYMQRSRE